jgi:hypothetical protein
MRKNYVILFIVISIIFNGCASTYKPIRPQALNYTAKTNNDGIDFAYQYDVLAKKGNAKYAKREDKRDIKVIAVRLTNNTDRVLNTVEDLQFYAGSRNIFLFDPLTIKNTIKQPVPIYLLYLLLSFTNLTVSNVNSTQVYPVGLVLGPGISVGNMVVAGSANTNFFDELNEYNIINYNIQPGETIYGIIGTGGINYDPLNVKIKE